MHNSYEGIEEQLDESEDILLSALHFQRADRPQDAMKYLKKSHERLIKLGQFVDNSTCPAGHVPPIKGEKKRSTTSRIVQL